MSDLEFDPEVIGPLPAGLRERQADLAAATTLPSPDTGASTAATAEAVRDLADLALGLSRRIGGLADGADASLTTYADSDAVVERSFAFRPGWWA
jgi:hypothetical protein